MFITMAVWEKTVSGKRLQVFQKTADTPGWTGRNHDVAQDEPSPSLSGACLSAFKLLFDSHGVSLCWLRGASVQERGSWR